MKEALRKILQNHQAILLEQDKNDLLTKLRFYEGTHSIEHLIEWTEELVLKRLAEKLQELPKR